MITSEQVNEWERLAKKPLAQVVVVDHQALRDVIAYVRELEAEVERLKSKSEPE